MKEAQNLRNCQAGCRRSHEGSPDRLARKQRYAALIEAALSEELTIARPIREVLATGAGFPNFVGVTERRQGVET